MSRRTLPVPRARLATTAAPEKPIHKPTRPQTTTQAGGTERRARCATVERFPVAAAPTYSRAVLRTCPKRNPTTAMASQMPASARVRGGEQSSSTLGSGCSRCPACTGDGGRPGRGEFGSSIGPPPSEPVVPLCTRATLSTSCVETASIVGSQALPITVSSVSISSHERGSGACAICVSFAICVLADGRHLACRT